MRERVLVAMSGGVDSSVAAALLVRDGFEVVGCTLHLWDYPDEGTPQGRCCAPEDIHDARRVCDALGIPHYSFDRRELFRREVVDPFVGAYVAGTTPSPCVSCNRSVKVRELVALADRLGASSVATGHYARIGEHDGSPALLTARDADKDQSYFLHMLGPETLSRLRFPLGEMTKTAVRSEALELDLPGATKGESQELCFVPTGRYDQFVEQRMDGKTRPGPIVDESGERVGTHDGLFRYTVGQRRNLGVSLPQRSYVLSLQPETNTVVLGSRDALGASGAIVEQVTLARGVALPFECDVRVRYRGTLHRCTVKRADAGAAVTFESAVQAVVPGQVAVFYDAERVLGGGTIVSATPSGRSKAPSVVGGATAESAG